MEDGTLTLTDTGLEIKGEFLTNSKGLEGNRDCFISILNDRLGAIATATGDAMIFTWSKDNLEIKAVSAIDDDDGEQWSDILALKSQGTWVVATSFNRAVYLSPNGSRNHFCTSFNCSGEEGRMIRASADEKHFGMIVNRSFYGAIKVYPDFQTKGTHDDDAKYIRMFEDDEDAEDKSIQDFQFLSGDRVVGGTSFGLIAVYDVCGEEIASVSITPNQDLGINGLAVSKDEKYIFALASAPGGGDKDYTLAVFSFDGKKLACEGKTSLGKMNKQPHMIGAYTSDDGSPILAVAAIKSAVDFYTFNAADKAIKYVHSNKQLTTEGFKHGCIAEGYIWAIDSSGAIVRLTAPGL